MLNKVFLIGNLTRDPELKDLKGHLLCKFTIAVNKTSDKENTIFIDVDAWNKTAKACGDFLKKGSRVLIEGKLKFENWTSIEGQKRNKISITSHSVKFLNQPNESPANHSPSTSNNETSKNDEVNDDDEALLSQIPF